jgi:hypothetical protein
MNKRNHEVEVTDSESEDEALAQVADIVLKGSHLSIDDLEPFDLYANKVHSRLHLNENEFRARLVKGYHALVDEIQEK